MSIFNIIPMAQNVTVVEQPPDRIGGDTETYVEGLISVPGALGRMPMAKDFAVTKNKIDVVVLGWAVGMALMLAYLIGAYAVFNRRTGKMKECDHPETLALLERCVKEVCKGNPQKKVSLRIGGNTPILKGILKPTILIPANYIKTEKVIAEEGILREGSFLQADLRHVFIHELCHLKHKDVWLNMLSSFLLCIYWYNPIIWLCFYVIRRDLEGFCDQRVIEITGERKEYATVLFKTALRKNQFIFATTSLQNGEKEVSKRIKSIAYFKKQKVYLSVIGVALAIVVGIVCLTNGAERLTTYELGSEYAFEVPESYHPTQTSSDDLEKDVAKLLKDYFQSYVTAELPKSRDITGYQIKDTNQIKTSGHQWDIIYPNATVFKINYQLTPEDVKRYSLAGGGFEQEEEGNIIYSDAYGVFLKDFESKGTRTFIGFLHPANLAEYGIDGAILKSLELADISVMPERILKYKTEYIGDHVKVGNIIAQLPLAQYAAGGIELKTDNEPYGLTVNYDMKGCKGIFADENEERRLTDSRGWDLGPDIKAQLHINATVLFALINNVETVTMDVTGALPNGAGYTYTYHLGRDEANQLFDEDIRTYSSSAEVFHDTFLNGLYQWHDEQIHKAYNNSK